MKKLTDIAESTHYSENLAPSCDWQGLKKFLKLASMIDISLPKIRVSVLD